jgi:hypothetical protein
MVASQHMVKLHALALPVLCAISLLHLGAARARADAVRFGPHDVRSTFHVAKSENQNQVHYAVRLDAECRPVGTRPVFAYWQRLKGKKRVDGELDGLGSGVYGASDEQKVARTAQGGSVELFVKALKKVRITIEVQKSTQGCRAVPYTTILGQRVRLSHAFLQLGLFGVLPKYVDVVGYRVSDGVRIAERHKN